MKKFLKKILEFAETLCDVSTSRYVSTSRLFPVFILIISIIQIFYFSYVCVIEGIAPLSENPYIGPPIQSLVDYGGNTQALTRDQHQIWRLLSYMFLHAGVYHLISNLFCQLTVGWYIESIWGPTMTLTCYFLSGIGGGLYSAAFQGGMVSVGPSGCVTGLFGMAIIETIAMWKYLRHPKFQLYVVCFCWFSIFLSGYTPGVDNFVHTFGFLFGTSTSLILFATRFHPRWKACFSCITGILLLLSLLITGFTLMYIVSDFECLGCCYALGSYQCKWN